MEREVKEGTAYSWLGLNPDEPRLHILVARAVSLGIGAWVQDDGDGWVWDSGRNGNGDGVMDMDGLHR